MSTEGKYGVVVAKLRDTRDVEGREEGGEEESLTG